MEAERGPGGWGLPLPSRTAPPGTPSRRRARPGCAPRALPWASPLGLAAGLQQAGAVPLRRRLVSRVLPGSQLRNSGGSASLRWPQPGWHSERPLHAAYGSGRAGASPSGGSPGPSWGASAASRIPGTEPDLRGGACVPRAGQLGAGGERGGRSGVLWTPPRRSAPPSPSALPPRLP